ncbi:MAG: DEAD/DEAH box helicase [Deinococcota bacterium]|nr:DEAD/DEAH box helicase [Deinococcota bacterium]
MAVTVPNLPPALAGAASYHEWLKSREDYRGQIRAYAFLPGRPQGQRPRYEGVYAPYLGRLGIVPYRHQAEALVRAEAGENLVVATPTASGKSLAYQIPTLHTLDTGGTVLYLFPTKALAHDQLEKLAALAAEFALDGLVASYDGDTASSRRRGVRAGARCLLSNPDMLHYGILPHHAAWARFLGVLSFIVVDELHYYRGVMGTHAANILRRLLRLARHYGAAPQVIAASATIGNPAEHAANLTGLPFGAVTEDYGPRADREFLFWRPPDLPGDGKSVRRRSPNTEAADLAARFVKAGLKSIFFCNSRKSAELLRRYAAGQLSEDEAAMLSSYRAGYDAEDRRRIEAAFKRGDIRVLTATSALELGVDVGGVDAVAMVGYPGSMTALWQRAGRAGRGGRRALTLLIPGNDPLDEYYLNHPDLVTEGRAEGAVADPFNSELHPLHLACAAYEKPLALDEDLLGEANRARAARGEAVPPLTRRGERLAYVGPYPHARLSLRGLGGRRVVLRDGFGKRLGESDLAAALRELHPGAVFLHQGETYLVRNLDLDAGVAVLLPHLSDYYTQARSVTDIEILEREAVRYGVHVGRVRVTTDVLSYVRKRYFSEAVLDETPLELPELSYPTQALWFAVTAVAGAVHPSLLPAAIHALEHTLISLLPVFVLCERADVGGVSYPMYPATGEPTVFIYDGSPGGVGYSRAGASAFGDWLLAARDLLRDCPCQDGCPRCVLSPKCGNGNQYLDKEAALMLAEALLARLEQTALPKLRA